MGHEAAQAGGHIAAEAAEQGKNVASETRQQASNLVREATSQARSQARQQQERAAGGLRALGTELRSMADGGDREGPGAQVVRRGADVVEQAAGWLDARQPGDLVREVRQYASRHPGTFLAGAAIAGLLAGRLARALAGDAGDGAGRKTEEVRGGQSDLPGPRPLHAPSPPGAGAQVRHGPSGTEVGP